MKTAVIYTRVSSDDQASGTSLESQEREIRAWCARNAYRVLRHYSEAHTAKTAAGRQQFMAAVADCKKSKADALVVWKLNRCARNVQDGANIRASLKAHGCQLVSVTEPLGDDPAGTLMTNILFAYAQYNNEERSEVCRLGMQTTARKGGWCWLAPAGYVLDRAGGLPVLKPDGALSIHIATAIRKYAAGEWTKAQAYKLLEAQGMKYNTLCTIFTKPVYGGIIRSGLTDGQDVTAAFPGLVKQEVFYNAETRYRSERQRPRAYLKNNEDFVLVGLLRCPVCGEKLVGYFSTGKMGKRYPYYACKSNGHIRMPRDPLDNQIRALLKSSMELDSVFSKSVQTYVDAKKIELASSKSELSQLQRKATLLGQKLDRLTDGYASGVVDQDDYITASSRLKAERAEINSRMVSLANPTNFADMLICLRSRFPDFQSIYDILPVDKRKHCLMTLFGGLIVGKDRKLYLDRRHPGIQSFLSDHVGQIGQGSNSPHNGPPNAGMMRQG